MKYVLSPLLVLLLSGMFYTSVQAQSDATQSVSENGMTVTWYHQGDRVYFDMEAPTTGWVAIGFNTSGEMKDVYLLMGRVEMRNAEVVEHYTSSPGNYESFEKMGAVSSVASVRGSEESGKTTLHFSLPHSRLNKYAKNLAAGSEYVMVMAYSTHDDFQHHSRMRTSVPVSL